jgi:hypothetical protein
MKHFFNRFDRRIIYIIIAFVFCFGIFIGQFTDVKKIFLSWTLSNTIAFISLIFAFVMLVWKTFEARRMTIRPSIVSKRLDGRKYLFAMSIENMGNVTIFPERAFLFVDEGVYDNNKRFYDFPFLLEHTDGVDNCTLKNCCLGQTAKYPKDDVDQRFRKKFNNCYEIKGLSVKAIQYITPGELFKDSLIIDFPNKGAYRACLIVIGKKNNPCCCTSVQINAV